MTETLTSHPKDGAHNHFILAINSIRSMCLCVRVFSVFTPFIQIWNESLKSLRSNAETPETTEKQIRYATFPRMRARGCILKNGIIKTFGDCVLYFFHISFA